MKTDQVLSLTATFEGHAQQTEYGVEYWLAREHITNNEADRRTHLEPAHSPQVPEF